MTASLPTKLLSRLVGRLKRVEMHGDARIHRLAAVKGQGSIVLHDGAWLGRHVFVDLRGGSLVLGEKSSIPSNAVLHVHQSIVIGEATTIMHFSLVYGMGGVTIGDRVLIGNHSLITSTMHAFEGREPITSQGMVCAPVVIKDDAWIGAYSLIGPGVTIGKGAIIGSHSLVKEDVPDYAVVAGTPARLIRFREAPDSL